MSKVGKPVVDAMNIVIKVYTCCLSLDEYNENDKKWCRDELYQIENGLRDERGKWVSFHVEHRIQECINMREFNDRFKLGLSDKFINDMKAAYTPVVYELIKDLPTWRIPQDQYEERETTFNEFRKIFLQ